MEIVVVLDNIRSMHNIGSIFRTLIPKYAYIIAKNGLIKLKKAYTA